MTSISNGLGQVLLETHNPASGSIGLVNGGVYNEPFNSYKNINNNIRVKCDNQTTNHQLSNLTGAIDGPKPRYIDKSTYRVHSNNRGNINPTVETQMGLKGPNIFQNTTHTHPSRTTMKQTTLFTHNGIANTVVPNDMLQTNYTTKDGSGGSTSIPTNKNLINNYLSGGNQFTGTVTHTGPGEVVFKELDNDKIRTEGVGTYCRAAPELSRVNHIFKEQVGDVQINPNRLHKEDRTRTDPALISGLLTNGLSIYNNGVYTQVPAFYCDSRPNDYSPSTLKSIPKEEIPDRNIPRVIPVHNSHKNANEIIVRNITDGQTENPMLFNNRTITSPSNNMYSKCYSSYTVNPMY